ncbi:MAG: VOC family protein [Pseudomonadota bacterium]|nr:VOC family protein [Pseudomonadota bacterium]
MSKKVFVNLPVADLARSMAFFKAVGYEFNPQFTDETAACMVISEHNYAMLLTHARFKDFAPKAIADARKTTEVLVAISYESRAEVDEVVRKAVAAGGNTYNQPQDHGFMYGHGFQDPDGHIWEVFWMDPAVANG